MRLTGSANNFVGVRLRLSRGRSRKVYVLMAASTVPSRSSRYSICGFMRLELCKCKQGVTKAITRLMQLELACVQDDMSTSQDWSVPDIPYKFTLILKLFC